MKEMFEVIYLADVVVNIIDKYGYTICELNGNVTDCDESRIVIDYDKVINIPLDLIDSTEKETINGEYNITEYTICTQDYSYVIDVMQL